MKGSLKKIFFADSPAKGAFSGIVLLILGTWLLGTVFALCGGVHSLYTRDFVTGKFSAEGLCWLLSSAAVLALLILYFLFQQGHFWRRFNWKECGAPCKKWLFSSFCLWLATLICGWNCCALTAAYGASEGILNYIKAGVDELRSQLAGYPGINVNFSQPIQNAFEELLSGTRSYFALKLYGENLDLLRNKATEIRNAVADIPGVVDLSVEQNFGQPQLQVKLKHHLMSHLGVTGEDIMELIEGAVGGVNAGTIYKDVRRYNINVRLQEKFRMTPEALGKLKVKARNGRYVRLDSVADIVITEGPVQINREKIQRRWVIQGNVSGRAPSEIVADMRKAIAAKVDLPAGYFVEFGGQFENQERAMKKRCIIVPIVIGIILLLWLAFNSFRSSLIVMINVPLALIGGVFGLWATDQLLSVPAAVGFITLFGIAMQDAVVMVTDFRELRAAGVPLYDAIIRGSKVRFKSVILTTLTTLQGLIPLPLSHGIGAEVQKPLAAIVVFGLATSTLLTLFFLPSLYYTIEKRFDRSGEKAE